MLAAAVDDALSMVGVVQIDYVVGDEVEGAVEVAQGLVVEASYSIGAVTEASVVHVGSEEAGQGVEVLAVERPTA